MIKTHKPKKELGQSFLNDQRILGKIVEACALTSEDNIVEIGPGKGSLTRLLAGHVKILQAVEYDKDLVDVLNLSFPRSFIGNPENGPPTEAFGGDNSKIQIIHADFLKWDFDNAPARVKVIGNIPYYISTPIIEHLLEHRAHVTEAFLTVQKEFGERLAAKPGGKDYGSLSCFVQYYADVKVLFKISRGCFTPAPKVDSCFVRIAFHSKPIYHPTNESKMFKVIRTAFAQRRKNILNALSSLVDKETLTTILTKLGLFSQARPETLSLQNYIDIADSLC